SIQSREISRPSKFLRRPPALASRLPSFPKAFSSRLANSWAVTGKESEHGGRRLEQSVEAHGHRHGPRDRDRAGDGPRRGQLAGQGQRQEGGRYDLEQSGVPRGELPGAGSAHSDGDQRVQPVRG